MQKFHQLCTQMRVRIEIFICFVWFETSHLIGPRCYDTKLPREGWTSENNHSYFSNCTVASIFITTWTNTNQVHPYPLYCNE